MNDDSAAILLSIFVRFLLASLGVAFAWLGIISFSIHRSVSSITHPPVRTIADLHAAPGLVQVSGKVVASDFHRAQCSEAKCIQSRLSFYTKPRLKSDASWDDTKYFIFHQDPYAISDGTGTLTPPSTLWIEHPHMASVECLGSDLAPAVLASLIGSFGGEAADDLRGKLVRIDEFFIPVGAQVAARVDVREGRASVVAVQTGSAFESLPPTTVWEQLQITMVLTAIAVILVAVAITYNSQ